MTHGTIAGLLIPDLINKKPNAWEDIYDPSRTSLKATGDFFKEMGIWPFSMPTTSNPRCEIR
jgi:hypothetical protein